jgi:molecular chaperone DnaK
LSDEEIEQMVQDAEANAAEDQKFEEMVQTRNTADGMVHSSKKMIEEAGDKATDEEKAAVQAAIDTLEEALKGDDKEAIDAATATLTEASGAIAQKMYAEDAAAQGGAEAAGEAGADDAVDAEFEEVKDEAKDEDKK